MAQTKAKVISIDTTEWLQAVQSLIAHDSSTLLVVVHMWKGFYTDLRALDVCPRNVGRVLLIADFMAADVRLEARKRFDLIISYPVAKGEADSDEQDIWAHGSYKLVSTSASNAVRRVLDTIDLKNVKIVLNTGDETLLNTLAKLRKEFNISGGFTQELVALSLNKIACRTFCGLHNLSVPKHVCVDVTGEQHSQASDVILEEIGFKLGFPIFAKPEGGSGAYLSSIINNATDLKKWFIKARELSLSCPVYCLEEFITGQLYIPSFVIRTGKVYPTGMVWYIVQPSDYAMKYAPMICITIPRSNPLFDRAYALVDQIVHTMRLPDCAGFQELFLTPDDRLILGETTPRTCGFHEPLAHEIEHNVDCEGEHLLSLLSDNPPHFENATGYHGAIVTFPVSQEGVVKAKCGVDSSIITSAVYAEFWGEHVKIGAKLVPALHAHGAEYAYQVVLKNNSYEVLYKEALCLANSFCPIVME